MGIDPKGKQHSGMSYDEVVRQLRFYGKPVVSTAYTFSLAGEGLGIGV
jgi:hypothetical protein